MPFKYLPKDRVDVLQCMKIRFSPLASLNDPFESLPLVDFPERHGRVLEFESMLRENSSNQPEAEHDEGFLQEFVDVYRVGLERHLNPCAYGEKVIAELKDKFCVLSLSRTNNSLLMWSHYASEGAGYVVSFDQNHPFIQSNVTDDDPRGPTPVLYSKNRPIYPDPATVVLDELFCHKPIEWAYEEEERLFHYYRSNEKIIGKDCYGESIRLTELPASTIDGIYIGYNAKKELIEKVKNSMRTNNIECTLFKAHMHPMEYKIEFEQI